MVSMRSTIREMLPVLSLLFAGWWRDISGLNKPIMFLGLLAEVITGVIQLFCVWQWNISPRITSLTDAVISGFLGGSKVFAVGATLVITDNSNVQDRTTRYYPRYIHLFVHIFNTFKIIFLDKTNYFFKLFKESLPTVLFEMSRKLTLSIFNF